MGPTRILVVENEPVIREIIVEVLTDEGFAVDEASDADQAGALIDNDGYKLLVTDIEMAGPRNGFDLAERARQHTPRLPVLFVTARLDVRDRLAPGDVDTAFLAKPFGIAALVGKVRALVGSAD